MKTKRGYHFAANQGWRGECIECGNRDFGIGIRVTNPYKKTRGLCYDCLIQFMDIVENWDEYKKEQEAPKETVLALSVPEVILDHEPKDWKEGNDNE